MGSLMNLDQAEALQEFRSLIVQSHKEDLSFDERYILEGKASNLLRRIDPSIDNGRKRSAFKYIYATRRNFWPQTDELGLDYHVYCATCGHGLCVNQSSWQWRHLYKHQRGEA